jgi:outer membrane protein OmpA-like peptidoglycan-associated protein
MRNKLLGGMGIAIALLFLIGCAHSPPPKPSLWQFRQDRVQELQALGVRFVQTGETILVSIPSDKFFYPHSSNISPHGSFIVPPLVRLLATYQTGIMKISGHTDNLCPNEMFNRALSERQARRMADCLVDYGMDARLIYVLGCGSSEPIASNVNRAGRAANRRVDIQFRFLSGDNE